MSSAHRPTWDPAQGKDARTNSKMYSSRDMAAQTRLKFRQPGQGTTAEISRMDLKLELLAAERASEMRKAKGLPGFAPDAALALLIEGAPVDVAGSRREVLAAVGGLDADDDEDDDEVATSNPEGKGKGRAVEEDEEEEESDSDDDEDETAELLRELEKIKRERAEEKEKIEREKAASDQTSREEEIATGNPLLNLQSALNVPGSPSPSMMSSSTSSSFGVKRRWDDDVIFKNQARGTNETPKREFVNDLLRTEFHKRFLKRDKARPSASHDVVPSFHAAPPTPDSLDRFFPPSPVSRSTRTPARTSADRYDARGSDVSVVDFEVMLNGDGSMLTEGMPHFGVDESFLGGEGDYVGRSPAKSMLSKVVSPVKVSMSVSPTFPFESSLLCLEAVRSLAPVPAPAPVVQVVTAALLPQHIVPLPLPSKRRQSFARPAHILPPNHPSHPTRSLAPVVAPQNVESSRTAHSRSIHLPNDLLADSSIVPPPILISTKSLKAGPRPSIFLPLPAFSPIPTSLPLPSPQTHKDDMFARRSHSSHAHKEIDPDDSADPLGLGLGGGGMNMGGMTSTPARPVDGFRARRMSTLVLGMSLAAEEDEERVEKERVETTHRRRASRAFVDIPPVAIDVLPPPVRRISVALTTTTTTTTTTTAAALNQSSTSRRASRAFAPPPPSSVLLSPVPSSFYRPQPTPPRKATTVVSRTTLTKSIAPLSTRPAPSVPSQVQRRPLASSTVARASTSKVAPKSATAGEKPLTVPRDFAFSSRSSVRGDKKATERERVLKEEVDKLRNVITGKRTTVVPQAGLKRQRTGLASSAPVPVPSTRPTSLYSSAPPPVLRDDLSSYQFQPQPTQRLPRSRPPPTTTAVARRRASATFSASSGGLTKEALQDIDAAVGGKDKDLKRRVSSYLLGVAAGSPSSDATRRPLGLTSHNLPPRKATSLMKQQPSKPSPFNFSIPRPRLLPDPTLSPAFKGALSTWKSREALHTGFKESGELARRIESQKVGERDSLGFKLKKGEEDSKREKERERREKEEAERIKLRALRNGLNEVKMRR